MADLEGRRLGPYLIGKEVGQGGMATIYQAKDTHHQRPVAVKVLRPDLENEEDFLKRFQREAQNMARLQHPHILPVYDSGIFEETGQLYIVMAWVAGGSVDKRLEQREGTLPLEEATRIVEQVAAALDFAHRHQVIHRDVKPSNILLTEDGQAILADFGIAKAAHESRLTVSGSSMGTPFYMAPEQIQDRALDARADIYALGASLYHMLTGRPPFLGRLSEVLLQHINQVPPPLETTNSKLPATLNDLMSKALAKDPQDRYQTAGELALALRANVSGGKKQKISSLWLTISGIGLLLVLLVGLFVFAPRLLDRPAAPVSTATPVPVEPVSIQSDVVDVETATPTSKPTERPTLVPVATPQLAAPDNEQSLPQGTRITLGWRGPELQGGERFRVVLYDERLNQTVPGDWTTQALTYTLPGLATGNYRWQVLVERQVETTWVEVTRSEGYTFAVLPIAEMKTPSPDPASN